MRRRCDECLAVESALVTLEKLHVALMLLRRLTRVESAEVAPLSSLRIFLSRVQTILTRFEFSNHRSSHLSHGSLHGSISERHAWSRLTLDFVFLLNLLQLRRTMRAA